MLLISEALMGWQIHVCPVSLQLVWRSRVDSCKTSEILSDFVKMWLLPAVSSYLRVLNGKGNSLVSQLIFFSKSHFPMLKYHSHKLCNNFKRIPGVKHVALFFLHPQNYSFLKQHQTSLPDIRICKDVLKTIGCLNLYCAKEGNTIVVITVGQVTSSCLQEITAIRPVSVLWWDGSFSVIFQVSTCSSESLSLTLKLCKETPVIKCDSHLNYVAYYSFLELFLHLAVKLMVSRLIIFYISSEAKCSALSICMII